MKPEGADVPHPIIDTVTDVVTSALAIYVYLLFAAWVAYLATDEFLRRIRRR